MDSRFKNRVGDAETQARLRETLETAACDLALAEALLVPAPYSADDSDPPQPHAAAAAAPGRSRQDSSDPFSGEPAAARREEQEEDEDEKELNSEQIKIAAMAEVVKYLKRKPKRPPYASDPLDWWRENEARFPHIALLARRYLASSAPSERVFSHMQIVVDKKKTSLSKNKVERLVFLRYNHKLLEKWQV